MTKRQIDKLIIEIAENLQPLFYISDILNYLNDTGLLHPSHDDTFLWDKEILEIEYPKICAEIRADEREKVINNIKWNIDNLAK